MNPSAPQRVFASSGLQPLFNRAKTKEIEAWCAMRLPAHTLMQRAGLATARLAMAVAPHASRIVVVAGPGNNGGDGLAAATCLHAWGKPLEVWLVGDEATLPADAAAACAQARRAGVRVLGMEEVMALIQSMRASTALGSSSSATELWIDALLGIGASRAPSGLLAEVITHLNRQRSNGAHVLSIDSPSGLDVDTGCPFGAQLVTADHTLALLTLKPGLFTAHGRDHAGDVWFDDLWRDDDVLSDPRLPTAWLSGCGVAPQVPRLHAQHKGSFGDVAVVGGAPGMVGAALLASRAAAAAGAGRVYLNALDPSFEFDVTRPELMCHRDWWQSATPATLTATTVVSGCGGGDAVGAALPRLMSLAGRLVLDADALNAIARDVGLQAALIGRANRHQPTVITPHPLEAGRLLGIDTNALQNDRLAAAARLAEHYRCVVVLKGSGTLIAAPDEVPRINASGNASLASAGTGDVLAGWIGGRWASLGLEGVGSSMATPRALIELVADAVADHGRAAEPLRPGAIRADDLVEQLHAIARGAPRAG